MRRRSRKMGEMRMTHRAVNMARGHTRGHLVNTGVRVIIRRGWADIMGCRGTTAAMAVPGWVGAMGMWWMGMGMRMRVWMRRGCVFMTAMMVMSR